MIILPASIREGMFGLPEGYINTIIICGQSQHAMCRYMGFSYKIVGRVKINDEDSIICTNLESDDTTPYIMELKSFNYNKSDFGKVKLPLYSYCADSDSLICEIKIIEEPDTVTNNKTQELIMIEDELVLVDE